jgi:hypothetical protein
MRYELAETLGAIVESLAPPEGTGLVLTEAELDVPLEVGSGMRNGELVFYGRVPHSRWRSGVLPPVHLSHLRVALVDTPEEGHGS